MNTRQYKCCECRNKISKPKALLDFYVFTVCTQEHKLDIVSKLHGKINKAKVAYCEECL